MMGGPAVKVLPFRFWHFLYLASLVFVLLAAGYGLRERKEYQTGLATRRWPKTQGTVLESKVRHGSTRSSTGVGHSLGRRHGHGSSGTHATYSFYFLYSYTVKGKEYLGHRIRVGHFTPDPDEMAKRYPKGSIVTVYYDPDHPREAVLEPGIMHTHTVMMVTAWLLVIWLLAAMLYLLVAVPRGKARVRLNDRINRALLKLGFRFRPGKRYGFGAEPDSLAETTPFSLMAPRPGVKDPNGIATLERDGRLVELRNAGVPVALFPDPEDPDAVLAQRPVVEEGFLIHLALETRWMVPAAWSQEREDEPRPLAVAARDMERVTDLFFMRLGMHHLKTGGADGYWEATPDEDYFLPSADYDLDVDFEAERYKPLPFDTRVGAFDEFFRMRRAGQRVRALLSRPDAARQVMHPLDPWKHRLFDLHVGQTLDAWIAMVEPVDWDQLLKDLPPLLEALCDFAARMERVLLEDPAAA